MALLIIPASFRRWELTLPCSGWSGRPRWLPKHAGLPHELLHGPWPCLSAASHYPAVAAAAAAAAAAVYVMDSPELFLQLDDTLVGEVRRMVQRSPDDPALRAAGAVLRRLDRNDLYLWVAEVPVPDTVGSTAVQYWAVQPAALGGML